MKKVNKLSKILIYNNETISTMESCTGGYIANILTNVENSSKIIKYSEITYCNEFKIKSGINKKTIDKYSVYSIEVAKEMSKCISDYTKSTYGIGITGKINKPDVNNECGSINKVFISIYNRSNNSYIEIIKVLPNKTRSKVKKCVAKVVINELIEVADKKNSWKKTIFML